MPTLGRYAWRSTDLMKDIGSFESFILKPVTGTNVLPEMSKEGFQMGNCHELVTAHTELVLETNTSNKPRRTVCKREGQERVTGTLGARAGAQNGSMNDISGLAGGASGYSLSFQLLLSVSYQGTPRETKKSTNPKTSERTNLHRSHCHLFLSLFSCVTTWPEFPEIF